MPRPSLAPQGSGILLTGVVGIGLVAGTVFIIYQIASRFFNHPSKKEEHKPAQENVQEIDRSNLTVEKLKLILEESPSAGILNLQGCSLLTDEIFPLIARLEKLEELNLNKCNITAAGIEKLKNHPTLHTLVLTDCKKITDEVFTTLTTLKKLRQVNLDGCDQITSKGRDQLKPHLSADAAPAEVLRQHRLYDSVVKSESPPLTLTFDQKSTLVLPYFYKPALIASSSYFEKLFTSGFKESDQPTLSFNDVEKGVFANLINEILGDPPELRKELYLPDFVIDKKAFEAQKNQVFQYFVNHCRTAGRFLMQKMTLEYFKAMLRTFEENDIDPSETDAFLFDILNFAIDELVLEADVKKSLIRSMVSGLIANSRGSLEQWAHLTSKFQGSYFTEFKLFNVDDAKIQRIVQFFPALESLNLSNSTHLPNLACLAPLQNLSTLDLCMCRQMEDSDLVSLENVSSLRTLEISWCKKITDNSLQQLTSLEHLEAKYCGKIKGTAFGQLLNLVSLNVLGCSISREGFSALKTLTKLQSLECDNATAEDFNNICGIRGLHSLHIHSVDSVNRNALRTLCNLTELSTLFIRDNNTLTDDDFSFMYQMENLTSLSIGFFKFKDGALAHLKRCPRLTSIDFFSLPHITDEGISQLLDCKSLRSLDISRCPLITEASLAPFREKGIIVKYSL